MQEGRGKVQRVGMKQRHDDQGGIGMAEPHFHGGGQGHQGAGSVAADDALRPPGRAGGVQ